MLSTSLQTTSTQPSLKMSTLQNNHQFQKSSYQNNNSQIELLRPQLQQQAQFKIQQQLAGQNSLNKSICDLRQFNLKELTIANRCLIEVLEVTLEFKRMMDRLFQELSTNHPDSPLLAYKTHYYEHYRLWRCYRKCFDDQLARSVPNLDSHQLINCRNRKCKLPFCNLPYGKVVREPFDEMLADKYIQTDPESLQSQQIKTALTNDNNNINSRIASTSNSSGGDSLLKIATSTPSTRPIVQWIDRSFIRGINTNETQNTDENDSLNNSLSDQPHDYKRRKVDHYVSTRVKPSDHNIANFIIEQQTTIEKSVVDLHKRFVKRFNCPICPQRYTNSIEMLTHLHDCHKKSHQPRPIVKFLQQRPKMVNTMQHIRSVPTIVVSAKSQLRQDQQPQSQIPLSPPPSPSNLIEVEPDIQLNAEVCEKNQSNQQVRQSLILKVKNTSSFSMPESVHSERSLLFSKVDNNDNAIYMSQRETVDDKDSDLTGQQLLSNSNKVDESITTNKQSLELFDESTGNQSLSVDLNYVPDNELDSKNEIDEIQLCTNDYEKEKLIEDKQSETNFTDALVNDSQIDTNVPAAAAIIVESTVHQEKVNEREVEEKDNNNKLVDTTIVIENEESIEVEDEQKDGTTPNAAQIDVVDSYKATLSNENSQDCNDQHLSRSTESMMKSKEEPTTSSNIHGNDKNKTEEEDESLQSCTEYNDEVEGGDGDDDDIQILNDDDSFDDTQTFETKQVVRFGKKSLPIEKNNITVFDIDEDSKSDAESDEDEFDYHQQQLNGGNITSTRSLRNRSTLDGHDLTPKRRPGRPRKDDPKLKLATPPRNNTRPQRSTRGRNSWLNNGGYLRAD